MPIYTCQMDTENKSIKFMIDGQELPVQDFSIASYTYPEYDDSGDSMGQCHEAYCAFSIMSDKQVMTRSYSYRDGQHPMSGESYTNRSVAKELFKVIRRAEAETGLINAFKEINKK
jgi:hypothetical protein